MQIIKVHSWKDEPILGLAVVIDVIRAFTTAAFAFAKGATKIIPVQTVEEALKIHLEDPHTLLMGEVNCLKPECFHFDNSPFEINQSELNNHTLVHRTSAGTQGIAKALQTADEILAASFVVAEATFKRIQAINPPIVTLVITGSHNGDEDQAFADYLEKKLLGENPNIDPYLERVKNAPDGKRLLEDGHPEDLQAALHYDLFDFAMQIDLLEKYPALKRINL